YMLKNLVKLLAPLIPFTAEEAWRELPDCLKEDIDSVHLALYSNDAILIDSDQDKEELDSWETYIEIRKLALKELEEKRASGEIGGGLDAEIHLTVPEGMLNSANGEDWADFLIVSQVHVTAGEEISVSVEKAEGSKCNRCWKLLPEVGTLDPDDICFRCAGVLEGMDLND
ncbi:MAG: class I tRNA ligase family protein, partial [Candidatus Fermentibacteraceae bacterium]|nr:class I tRNA ligase family protein [Candidatus Fermentibacteraceae bacterium]